MKKKIQWSQILGGFITALVGFGCGILLVQSPHPIPSDNSWVRIMWIIGLLAVLYIATIIHMIIHEAGHLLFGHITGYRFNSFRILSFMWIKDGEHIRMRRLSIPGTGGQCLMSPPDMVDGKIPVILYNLGGSLANIFTGCLFLASYFLLISVPFLGSVMLIFSLVGLIFGILNGVPMRLGTVDNDGYNAYSLTRTPKAMQAFWIQMKVNQEISKGSRLRDMPDEWFQFPTDDELKNSMVAVVGVFSCNRLMDQHNFTQAKDQMKHMLNIESGMVGIHRRMMICDRLYLELIGKNRPDILKRFLSPQQQKFMQSMKAFPSVLRTQYAYCSLSLNDSSKAQEILKQFDKVATVYPYPNEIEAERELIQVVNNKLQ